MKLIAETAWHHQGDLDFFISLVDAVVSNSKADIVKLHITLDFDEYMSKSHPMYKRQKDWLFDEQDWDEIISAIMGGNKRLMMLFNDTSAIRFGMKYEPDLVEIHSVCLNDIFLLEYLKNEISNKTNIVIGVGGTALNELDHSINYLSHKNVILMHGFQNYPTRYFDINIKKIRKIMALYPNFKHGYADHTAWDESNNLLITLLGAAQGVDFIEKHVTTAYGQERVDWQSAISIEMFNELYNKIRLLEDCMGDGNSKLSKAEKDYSKLGPMKKAAVLKKDVHVGEKFTFDHFQFQRTGETTDLSQLDVIDSVGCEINEDLKAGSLLYRRHLNRSK